MMHKMSLATVALLSAGVFAAAPAFAETKVFVAALNGADEVPPIDTTASGTAEITVDDQAMTIMWKITTADLSGEATAAHIHGPAEPGATAAPVIDFSASIAEGKGEITAEQLAELESGMYYVNVHTEANPDGEIRGQLATAAP